MNQSKLFAFVILAAITLTTIGCATETAHNDGHANHGSHDNTPVRAKAQTPKPIPVPAFQKPEEIKELKPTLDPEQFRGNVKAAYAAVREIPKTIAQLPCYCRCDRSAGHKSLHSCFEDNHGANCTTCTDSVLIAYKMEKEQGATPEQIREALIKEYSGY